MKYVAVMLCLSAFAFSFAWKEHYDKEQFKRQDKELFIAVDKLLHKRQSLLPGQYRI